MATEKIELTKDGEAKLQAELRNLLDVEQPKVIEELTVARAQGDLSENADYDAARQRQGEIEDRIKQIETILHNAVIVNEKGKSKGVTLGSSVEILDLSDNCTYTYKVVGSVESDPSKNQVSNVSPLGAALLGKTVDSIVTIKVKKPYDVKILKIIK